MRNKIWKCDVCGKEFPDCSPPPEEAYESGRIEIRESSLLLPKDEREKGNCATNLNGDFCNIKCLIEFLKEKEGWVMEKVVKINDLAEWVHFNKLDDSIILKDLPTHWA